VIAAYLLYAGLFNQPSDALTYFTAQRSEKKVPKPGQPAAGKDEAKDAAAAAAGAAAEIDILDPRGGVTIPSQIRLV
jgi:hypothetical protein